MKLSFWKIFGQAISHTAELSDYCLSIPVCAKNGDMIEINKFQSKRDKLREEITANRTEKFGRAPTEQEIRGNTETLEFLRQITDNP